MRMDQVDFPAGLRELAGRVSQRPFRITFFGKMKAGKSSLINALLGAPLLPVKTITATAVRTNLTYADMATAEVVFPGGARAALSLEEAKAHIVYARDRACTALAVNLSVPSPWLRDGTVFTDTPGIDDLGELTQVAEGAIDETDLAVMVCDATRFLSESERAFAATLHKRLGGNVIFAINRWDLADDVDEINAIANVYLRTFGNPLTGTPTVVHTSAPRLGGGNVGALEKALQALIWEQKSALCETARGALLIRHIDEMQSRLYDERAVAEWQNADREKARLMAYLSRLDRVKRRVPAMVEPFEEACVGLFTDMGGVLTQSNMAYCINSTLQAFIDRFNEKLAKLKREFSIATNGQVGHLPQVTPRHLSAWGVGAFYDDGMNRAAFTEIMAAQQRELIRAVERAFILEERCIAGILRDENRACASGALSELDETILSLRQIRERLEEEAAR